MEERKIRQREVKGEGREQIWGGWNGRRRQQREEREKSIKESKYNKWHKEIVEENILEYLRKSRKEKKWRKVARFRLGNEMRKRRCWMKERQIVQNMWMGKEGMRTCSMVV